MLQSVLGLIGEGYQIFLLEDCLFSSEPHVGPAIRRMEQVGAISSTVKSLACELRHSVAEPFEKAALENLGRAIQLTEPEDLPA